MSPREKLDKRCLWCGVGIWLVVFSGSVALLYFAVVVEAAFYILAGMGLVINLLLLGLLNLRIRSFRAMEAANDGVSGNPYTWSILLQHFWTLLIPTVFLALILAVSAVQSVERSTYQRRAEKYSALNAALLARQLPTEKGELVTWVRQLRSFEQASPFLFWGEENQRYGIGADALRQIESQLQGQGETGSWSDWSSGKGYVWNKIGNHNGIVGIRYQLTQYPNSWMLILATVLVSVLGSILVGLWGQSRIEQWISGLTDRVDAIPHGRRQLSDLDRFPLEIETIEDELCKLEARFFSLHTAQKNAIETGHRNREMKTQFFAGMSHDLRSPLNSVIGFADLLLKGMDGELGPVPRRRIAAISQEAEKLLVLIADVLDTSKLKAGRLDLQCKWVPSVEILTECETVVRKLIGNRQIDLDCELQPGLPPVFIDKERIRQALLDLILRVMEVMERGTIRIRAGKEAAEGEGEGWLRVDIIDVDRAMDPEKRERLSQAFHSVEGMPAHNGTEGLSLGIALANDIIMMHDGQLVMGSDLNIEPVFTMILPLDEP